ISLDDLTNYFDEYPEEMSNFFLMEYLVGEKFSSDLLIEKGKIKAVVTRSNGILPKTNPPTQIADLTIDEEVESYTRSVCSVGIFDFFLQVEVGKDSAGRISYIETNPRLDATLPITMGQDINFY